MTENPFEIPQSLREVSEENLKQAHAACDQLMIFVAKAIDAWMEAMPSNPVTAGFKEVHGRAVQFAKDNADCTFVFSGKISNAQTLSEIWALQTQYAQDRMEALTAQAQELYSLIEEGPQKAERCYMATGTRNLASSSDGRWLQCRLASRMSAGPYDRQGAEY